MLTETVAGRTYDYSHSVGRGSQTGMGFSNPVAAAIGKDDVLFVVNRGSEGISNVAWNRVADNVVMLMFTEFGRRVHDNGSGTDHGAGGAAFVIGDAVNGGQYSEYPSLESNQLEQGDVVPNHDFRSIYSVLLEDWMGLDAKPIVEGSFEKLPFLG